MNHQVKSEFVEIAQKIKLEDKTEDQWAELESSDMFQKGDYVGGFDAIEMEFTFSLYEEGQQFWFQLPLRDVLDIAAGYKKTIDICPVNNGA